MSGFGGALGVLRVQLAHGESVAALPQPTPAAVRQLDDLLGRLQGLGTGAGFALFDRGAGEPPCWIRARNVAVVEVVPTEDPAAPPLTVDLGLAEYGGGIAHFEHERAHFPDGPSLSLALSLDDWDSIGRPDPVRVVVRATS